jgi:ribose transport system ATP-binding protein
MPDALTCTDITKGFGGIPVLTGVSLALAPGTVTALAGENGAGKSTLMKIIAGQVRPDSGSLRVGDVPAGHLDVPTARRLGVAIVPQELSPIPDMTVYENLFIGREVRGRAGLLDRGEMIARAREMLAVFDVDLDPAAPMRALSVAAGQIVEIVKATSRGASILLLDEPTSAITDREVEKLYEIVRELRARGVSMLYTTHRMSEIRALSDRVVVLRDGRLIVDTPTAAISDDEIVTAMIGRELENLFPDVGPAGGDVALEVRGLRVTGSPRPVSLTVRRGEILGLAGLVGAGRTELLAAVFGSGPSTAGTVEVAGRPVPRNRPAAAIAGGMALVPEDRKGAGLVLALSVAANTVLPGLSRFSRLGWRRTRDEARAVTAATTAVRLKARSADQEVGTLSGGNQQKVVLARWLTGKVGVLLLDEPTRGVDVGARGEIYSIITELASAGMAVLMASSDAAEVLGLSHRVLVMRDGGFAGELSRAELDDPSAQDRIFRLASGLDGTPTPPTGDPGHLPDTREDVHR